MRKLSTIAAAALFLAMSAPAEAQDRPAMDGQVDAAKPGSIEDRHRRKVAEQLAADWATSPVKEAETALSQPSYASSGARVTAQPPTTDAEVTRRYVDPAHDPRLSAAAMTQLLRKRIKYVFVIFNENESFDHEYGSFPGANGVYSTGVAPRSAEATPGFRQYYLDPGEGHPVAVQPFRLGPTQNATVLDSVDHSHRGLAAKLDVKDGVARMDGFAQDEFAGKEGPVRSPASVARARQFATLVMSHIDCDTIPFFWRYANRFTLFDDIFATEDTPSTPNAVAMIAGQAGETQWVKHGVHAAPAPMHGQIGDKPYAGTGSPADLPLTGDPNPYWGSQFAPEGSVPQPVSPREFYGRTSEGAYNVAPNLTFATVPLIAMGRDVREALAGDRDPETNEADIKRDIPAIAATGQPGVEWRWYQNGYDHEPTDPTETASHANFVAHHQGPQYFGYLADNDRTRENLRGEGDFFRDVAQHRLPPAGGIIYIRGGFGNLDHLVTPIQNPGYPRALTPEDIATIRAAKSGDDDHPSYADRQISEAMAARVVNAVAADPKLWAQSAIVITYDESDGYYDHVAPRILSYGPDGLPLSRGVRVPLLVISPYARVHTVSHAEGDHNAVIETIEQVFGLRSLSGLPEEAAALKAGDSAAFNRFGPPGFHQRHLGPRDTPSPTTDSLISAFDPARLTGRVAPLPGSYAMLPDAVVTSLPHYGGQGCAAIGVVPEDVRQGIAVGPPEGFNPLPATLPRYNLPIP